MGRDFLRHLGWLLISEFCDVINSKSKRPPGFTFMSDGTYCFGCPDIQNICRQLVQKVFFET